MWQGIVAIIRIAGTIMCLGICNTLMCMCPGEYLGPDVCGYYCACNNFT